MSKRAIVRWFVGLTNGWNEELHQAIEQRVQDGYRRDFAQAAHVDVELIKQMREFYYQRMMATASLLIGGAAFIVSLVALLISVVALFKS